MRMMLLVGATVVGVLSAIPSAVAYVYPGHALCPWNKPGHSWKGFLLGEYGTWGRGGPFFSIKFERDIGSIAAGRCYTVTYRGNSSWVASGWNRIQKISDSEKNKARVGGDPAQYVLNVWGAQFRFNEGGEVFQGDTRVGRLYCHIGSECDK